MADGFSSYEGNAVLWVVYHNHGTTHVHATSEVIALARFMAKSTLFVARGGGVKALLKDETILFCIWIVSSFVVALFFWIARRMSCSVSNSCAVVMGLVW
jgi:hypothetical protein